ncbi:uncharacterized protein LOC129919949 [Episyrphus balteatus]|uniref:uncharacterized protein LOC129919949 n=1 Tax=Episyrphus balteatus TaxID=286459 RepID=UPI002486191E|nr:uncharacterized protein LOC129919949 [Episyrphus balteatus]
MAGYMKIIFVTALIVACSAEPQRFRNSRFNRFSARQEEAPQENAPPAKAPYPAAGFKPDVPFELPTETTTASIPTESTTVQQLDSTYGPPTTTEIPTTTYSPTTEIAETDTEVPVVVLEDEDDDTESVISVAVSYDNPDAPEEQQRLVFGQRIQPLNNDRRAPLKLRAALAEPIYLEDGSFVYSAPL